MKIDNESLPKELIDFLRYMSVIKNKSTLTVREYEFDLRTFLHFMVSYRALNNPFDLRRIKNSDFENADIYAVDKEFLASVTLEDAYAYLSYCKDIRGNSAKTRARKTSSLRSFYKFLFINNIIPANNMQYLTQPKLDKTQPKYLSVDQSISLLNCVDGKNKERNYAIIMLFLNSGLRLSELVSLDIKDIRRSNGRAEAVVRGKGAKERTVYLNEAALNAIDKYLAVRPSVGLSDPDALFISERLNRISPKTVEYTVKSFMKKAGLSGYSVHKLRHTAATLMYQTGEVDILVLKQILGHENLSTTEIYTHLHDTAAEQAVEKNPLNALFSQNNEDDED